MWSANIIGGVAIFLLGIGTAVLAWRLPYTMESSPGPGFLPLWLGIIMSFCAAFVIANDLKNRDAYRSEKLFLPETVKCLKVLALIVTVFLVLPFLGFSLGLGLITGACMRMMGKHSWISCGVTVIVSAICIHYLFGVWLTIPLPGGVIGW